MARPAWLRGVGPGIIVAATGLGAGDIVAAAVAGAMFGSVVLWAVLAGGLLKFVLNEGVARWQLVTGRTVLEGWIDHLPRFLLGYFLIYLSLWSFMVAGALMAATGLAAWAIWPVMPLPAWAILHALAALVIVWRGGYRLLESMMKLFVGLMFVTVLACALLVMPPPGEVLRGLFVPRLPEGGLAYVLGIIGGVGGSVTVLSYGYWMREAGLRRAQDLPAARVDLGLAYGLTALFGIAVVLVAAGVRPELAAGNGMALALADHLAATLGPWGKWVFLIGFWGAVFSSMLGVWHGVPYLFANLAGHWRNPGELAVESRESLSRTPAYRGWLLYMALAPMLLLALDRPVWVVVLYAVTGAFFMPLLAALLLYMNSRRRWLREQVTGFAGQALLLACLLLFAALLLEELWRRFIPA